MSKKHSNAALCSAQVRRDDEFYTLYGDIEDAVQQYASYLNGKVVYCNCDDPYRSQFVQYFIDNFHTLGLRCLVATSCQTATSPALKLTYDGSLSSPLPLTVADIGVTTLTGDGSFLSTECVELLKSCDIVITNPPFSLFRAYISLLFEYKKDFLVVGNLNAIIYASIVPYILSGVILVPPIGIKRFSRPDGSLVSLGNVCWFTTLDSHTDSPPIPLAATYSPSKYQFFDGYDVLNIDRVKDIPSDYYGVMGVPISYLLKHNRCQFELLGAARDCKGWGDVPCRTVVNGKRKYDRLLIKRLLPSG